MPPIGNILTADHLNYLIWRYLQEQGQAKAAVNLQRDWRSGQDPETLPFAKHIKPLALVKLVHKVFYITTPNKQSSRSMDASEEDAAVESQISPQSRKHGRETAANGLGLDVPTSAPSAKRIRRTNGTEYATNGSSMDIDQSGNTNHSRPEHPEPSSRSNSPGAEEATGMDLDGDEVAPASDEARMTLTNGPSVGVQSDKVAELGPETTVLTLPPGKHVTHTAWNPHDASLLAIAGDALCRIWTVAKPSATHAPGRPTALKHVDLLDSPEASLVSTLEWSPNGDLLAVATRRGSALCVGLVTLWTRHGQAIDEFPASEDMILTLRWNSTGRLLLGIANAGDSKSTIFVWHTQDADLASKFTLDAVVRDAAWIGESDFTVCGYDFIRQFHIDGSHINSARIWTENEANHSWSHVLFDTTTHVTAVAAEDEGIIAVMDASDKLHTTLAHIDQITSLAFQPVTNPSAYSLSSPRVLATSALDCTIRLWDIQRPFDLLVSLSLGPAVPPMAINFTPDGYLVAAASWNRVAIWNPEKPTVPMAIWNGDPDQWHGLAMNGMDQDSGIGEEEDIPPHSLSWDANGGKLAYGLKSQVAILNLRSPAIR